MTKQAMKPPPLICKFCGTELVYTTGKKFWFPMFRATDGHETVDEVLWSPGWGRRLRSHKERCLDCGDRRCREPRRWFGWRKWSPWA